MSKWKLTTKVNLETEPIFSLLEQKYNTPLVEAEYCLEAVSAERTSYTINHRPIDYEKLYHRGDRIRFATRLASRPPTEGKSL